MSTDVAQDTGTDDLVDQLRNAWLQEAEKALNEHDNTFAVLPIRQLVESDNYLAELVARGYTVKEPK